jgi:hypothetical protein
MIETIRRYSAVITACLLALCAATLLYSQFRHTPGYVEDGAAEGLVTGLGSGKDL